MEMTEDSGEVIHSIIINPVFLEHLIINSFVVDHPIFIPLSLFIFCSNLPSPSLTSAKYNIYPQTNDVISVIIRNLTKVVKECLLLGGPDEFVTKQVSNAILMILVLIANIMDVIILSIFTRSIF